MSDRIEIAQRGESLSDVDQAILVRRTTEKKDKIRKIVEAEYPDMPFIMLFEEKINAQTQITVALNGGGPGVRPSLPFYALWLRIQKMGREVVTKNCFCGHCE